MKKLVYLVLALSVIMNSCDPLGDDSIEEKRFLEIDASKFKTDKYDTVKIVGINQGSSDTIFIYQWVAGDSLEEKVFYSEELSGVFDVLIIGIKGKDTLMAKSVLVNEAKPASVLVAKNLDRLIHLVDTLTITDTVFIDTSGNGDTSAADTSITVDTSTVDTSVAIDTSTVDTSVVIDTSTVDTSGVVDTNSVDTSAIVDTTGTIDTTAVDTLVKPVGWWSFDEDSGVTAYDSSDNGINGILQENTSRVTGKFNKALQFRNMGANSDHVIIADTSLLDITEAITISFWVRVDSNFPGFIGQTLLQKGGISTGSSPVRHFENYSIQFADGYILFQYVSQNNIKYSDANYHQYEMTQKIEVKQWNHIGIRFTFGVSSSMAFFLNGVKEIGSWTYGSGNIAVVTNNYPLSVGAGINISGGTLSPSFASIDELKIWDEYLVDSEMINLWK